MISDGTGITAENLGNTLLSQFSHLEFERHIFSYVDTLEKAEKLKIQLDSVYTETGEKPLVFMTLVKPELAEMLRSANAVTIDLFNVFLKTLESALGCQSSHTVGKTHGVTDGRFYAHRMEAVEFALNHDDGVHLHDYERADIILIGVSRCGKTPSCLYMALHFGILAANYPFTEEDLDVQHLPPSLAPYKKKLFGLTISPERLQQIRTVRRPNSPYASLDRCRQEVSEIEHLYRKEGIKFLNSTQYSIEEITTKILNIVGLRNTYC